MFEMVVERTERARIMLDEQDVQGLREALAGDIYISGDEDIETLVEVALERGYEEYVPFEPYETVTQVEQIN